MCFFYMSNLNKSVRKFFIYNVQNKIILKYIIVNLMCTQLNSVLVQGRLDIQPCQNVELHHLNTQQYLYQCSPSAAIWTPLVLRINTVALLQFLFTSSPYLSCFHTHLILNHSIYSTLSTTSFCPKITSKL